MSFSIFQSTSSSTSAGSDSNTDISRKRRRDDDEEGSQDLALPSSKRRRKLERLRQRFKEQSQDPEQALKELDVYLEHPGLDCGAKLLVRQLRRQCDLIKAEKLPLSSEIPLASNFMLKDYFEYECPDSLPMGGEVFYEAMIVEAQAALDDLGVTFKKLLKQDKCPPSVSAFAKLSVWPIWQGKDDTAILNLRPSKNQGLPLSVFHTVFARFIATVRAKKSSSQSYTTAAFRAANEFMYGNGKALLKR